MITFAVLMSVVLVGCGNNTYQSEIDEAIKVMHDEGLTSIEKNKSSIYVYDDGNIIMVDDNNYKRYVEKQEDGTYEYLRSSKAEKKITSKNNTDYAEKNGKEIKK